jgi:hypothetical protein
MREIDDVQNAVDQRQAERDEGIERTLSSARSARTE